MSSAALASNMDTSNADKDNEIEADSQDDNEQDNQPKSQGLVIIGTYDGALLGFRISDGRQMLGYAPHDGCVKDISCSLGGRLASGDADGKIKLFNMLQWMEQGELIEHTEAVEVVKFWGGVTLMTGSSDGEVCVWNGKDKWMLMHKFHAHKSSLTSLAVHPSGRLMVSCSQDKSLRLFDMMRGTSAAILTLDAAADMLEWSPAGNFIAVLSPHSLLVNDFRNNRRSIYEEGDKSKVFQSSGFTAVLFLTETILVLGDWKGRLRLMRSGLAVVEEKARGEDENKSEDEFVAQTEAKVEASVTEICELSAETERSRVKVIRRGDVGIKLGSITVGVVFVVGMTSGDVEVWHFTGDDENPACSLLRVVKTGARLT